MDTDDFDESVLAARETGAEGTLSQVLLDRANARMRQARMGEALADLDELTTLHRAAGRVPDLLRCLHMSATASRFSGDVGGAITRAQAAWDEAPDHTPPKVAAATELGECYLGRKDGLIAQGWYERALTHGTAAGMIPSARGALLRKQAESAAMQQRFDLAALILRDARAAFEASKDPAAALQMEVEEASAWTAATHYDKAVEVLRSAEQHARDLKDEASLASLHLVWSALAVARGDLQAAVSFAGRARDQALSAVDPINYTAAVVALSELFDRLDRRQEAYGTLAVAWVTLGDLMGKEVARASIAPKIQALADRWGTEAFVLVRDGYLSSGAGSQ